MNKFYGPIGYGESVEDDDKTGKWRMVITERNLYGDVLRLSRRLVEGDKIIKDLTLGVEISLMADTYALNHAFSMQYIKYMGAYWTIAKVTPDGPRLILTLGGVYNGPTEGPPSEVQDDSGD